MDLSWTSMITQVLAVLYVAWLTASLRATQQKMDKYVENNVSNKKKNERLSLSLLLYTVFVVVVVDFFCFFPDQSCR
jgi:hypothetical protein